MTLSKNIVRLAVVGALALFLLQSVPLLETRWVEDEGSYGSVAYALLTEGRMRNPTFPDTDTESQVDTHPPAMSLTLATVGKTLGVGVDEFRLPSILAGIGVVIGSFLLGLELLGPVAGAIAAVLAATDNFLFAASRTVRPDVYVACLGVFAVWLYFRGLRKNSVRLAFASSLLIGAAINYHPNGIALAVSIGLLFLVEHKSKLFRVPRFWAFVLGIVLSVLPFALWITSSPERQQAFRTLWGRGHGTTLALVAAQEKDRFADFIGQSQRIPFPIHIPVRFHIALALLGAAIALLLYNRALLGSIAILIVPSLLLGTTEANQSSRYFVIVTPYLILLLVAAATQLSTTLWARRIAVTVLVVVAASQIAGNVYFLGRFRAADYSKLTASLRQVIPDGEPVYGALTFWLALHDRPFYSFSRTSLNYALQHGITYVISNDRVLLHGSGYGDNYYEPLREELTAFLRSHSQLVGEVHSDFYGDLEVYHVVNGTVPTTVEVK
jgi:4-amino-4-deoxy-L-arabinose transferase-like glycosyltransferase